MPNANGARQFYHVLGAKYVPREATAFVQVDAGTVEGRYTGRILSPVLKDGQGVIEGRSYCASANDSNDSAHEVQPCPGW